MLNKHVRKIANKLKPAKQSLVDAIHQSGAQKPVHSICGEYFIAYPEQVKVEVKNETKHKLEVEMKSESELTIKVSDWHKNGELPPVGEVCEAYIDYPPPVG